MLPVRIAWKQAVFVAVLVVAGAWQLSIVAQRTILPWTKATWRTRELNGMGRSAQFYLGRAGAEYLNFLRSVVPEDGPIVIPPGAVQFSEQNALQFYLMPRAAVGCPCKSQETLPKACVQCLLAPSHYVPAIGEFPPDSIMDGVKVFVPFESKYAFYRGVYALSFRSLGRRRSRGPSVPFRPALSCLTSWRWRSCWLWAEWWRSWSLRSARLPGRSRLHFRWGLGS